MVSQALGLMKTVFENCASWLGKLLEAVDGSEIVLAAFILVLVVSLLFIPLRGGNLVGDFGSFYDFNQGQIRSGKYSNGKRSHGSFRSSYKGKFAQGNSSSRVSRKGKHTRYYAGGSGTHGI